MTRFATIEAFGAVALALAFASLALVFALLLHRVWIILNSVTDRIVLSTPKNRALREQISALESPGFVATRMSTCTLSVTSRVENSRMRRKETESTPLDFKKFSLMKGDRVSHFSKLVVINAGEIQNLAILMAVKL